MTLTPQPLDFESPNYRESVSLNTAHRDFYPLHPCPRSRIRHYLLTAVWSLILLSALV